MSIIVFYNEHKNNNKLARCIWTQFGTYAVDGDDSETQKCMSPFTGSAIYIPLVVPITF